MKRLLSTVSTEALFYHNVKAEQNSKITIGKNIIPKNWTVIGFANNRVYLRILHHEEKRKLWCVNPGKYFEWDKDWLGVFSVSTSELIFVSDSLKKIMTTLEGTTAVLERIN